MFRRQVRDGDGGQRLQDLHEAPHQEHISHRLHGIQVTHAFMMLLHSVGTNFICYEKIKILHFFQSSV